jgi:hypothetical protein
LLRWQTHCGNSGESAAPLTKPTNPALHVAVRGPFTGHDRTSADTSLNLVTMNARYYAPEICRLIAENRPILPSLPAPRYTSCQYLHN